MNVPHSKPDATPSAPSHGAVHQWLGGSRIILDDRGTRREIVRDTGFGDDEWDEVLETERGSMSSSDDPVRRASLIKLLWLAIFAGMLPWIWMVLLVLMIWWWSGSIAGAVGLKGVPGRLAVTGGITMAGLAAYLIVNRHKAHRSRRRAVFGERSKRDEHTIRWAVGFNGMCHCCAYHIALLPREMDRCVVCPECGAAWRVDDWANDGGYYNFPHRQSEQPTRSGRLSHSDWITDARSIAVPVLGHTPGRARRRAVTRRAGRRFGDALGRKLMVLAVILIVAWPLVYAFSHGRMVGLFACIFLGPLLGLLVWNARDVSLSARARRLGDELIAARCCPCCEIPLRAPPARSTAASFATLAAARGIRQFPNRMILESDTDPVPSNSQICHTTHATC